MSGAPSRFVTLLEGDLTRFWEGGGGGSSDLGFLAARVSREEGRKRKVAMIPC
jgi:hypothetical protein